MSNRTEHAHHAGALQGSVSVAHRGQVAGNAAPGRLLQRGATLPAAPGKAEEMIALLASRMRRDPAEG